MRRAAAIDGGKRCILSEFPMIASLAIRIACSGSILAKPSANHADATSPSKESSCSPPDRLRLARSPAIPNRKVSSRSLGSQAGLTRWPSWIAREPVPKSAPFLSVSRSMRSYRSISALICPASSRQTWRTLNKSSRRRTACAHPASNPFS